MNTSLNKISWYGHKAWSLENEVIRTVVVPTIGAKLVSLFDKRTHREWLVDSGNRPLREISYGSKFTDQDMSGWDEMFPTIIECPYPVQGNNYGAVLPDHGEVWTLPWNIEQSPHGTLKLCISGKALPYQLTRTITYSTPDTLQIYYELKNLGTEKMAYLWAAHPQIVYNSEAKIILPSKVTKVCNTIPAEWGWGNPETYFGWPNATDPKGQSIRIDHAGAPSLRQGRKFFVSPDTHIEWAGIVRHPDMDWLRIEWDADKVPYFGVWVDEGALCHTSVIALEPTTGFYDSLETAWNKKEVATIDSGDKKTWALTVHLGTADQPFPMD